MKALSTAIFLAASLMPAAVLAQTPRANRPTSVIVASAK